MWLSVVPLQEIILCKGCRFLSLLHRDIKLRSCTTFTPAVSQSCAVTLQSDVQYLILKPVPVIYSRTKFKDAQMYSSTKSSRGNTKVAYL